MKRRKAYFLITLFLTLIVIILLGSGSSLLTMALDKNNSIPLGTFITWIGMVTLPLSVFFGIKDLRKPDSTLNKFLSALLKAIITLGIFWVPLSYLLAGNLSFSFSEKESFQGGQIAMRWFWRLTYGIGIGSMLTLVIYWVTSLIKRK